MYYAPMHNLFGRHLDSCIVSCRAPAHALPTAGPARLAAAPHSACWVAEPGVGRTPLTPDAWTVTFTGVRCWQCVCSDLGSYPLEPKHHGRLTAILIDMSESTLFYILYATLIRPMPFYWSCYPRKPTEKGVTTCQMSPDHVPCVDRHRLIHHKQHLLPVGGGVEQSHAQQPLWLALLQVLNADTEPGINPWVPAFLISKHILPFIVFRSTTCTVLRSSCNIVHGSERQSSGFKCGFTWASKKTP